ncbi:MAG TPA: oxygen-independent coproporphyrinogen III oxidase [Deltaproteobacteria bacterium]|nr:MAG: oxygen-independent coproporphyrinogen III oxidase [Deltaproteobacteria bacterium GWA2_45_12]HBF13741.1 oxygen-independent coproporphyrinogen III oxidase [Deltaproteobacteria bacterium]
MSDRFYNLLKKYDVPGPRYTSYPTVPAWSSEVGGADYEQSLKKLQKGERLSLYFHLPFCESLCHFCGCMQVITKDKSRSEAYVQTVLKEVQKVSQFIPSDCREVTQIHFGGGTPNFVQPFELTQILDVIRKHFNLLPGCEVAIELHPKTSTRTFNENLARLGFNRISLGVQDLDPVVQKLINRNQTHQMTKEMVDQLRELGFSSFNFDLVYGLPGQTMKGWEETLNQVLQMAPDRLAVYSYAHVPWARPVQRTFKDSDLPPPEMKLKLFEKAHYFFTENGYRLIGMDHFAKKEDELSKALDEGTIHRNFMGYSTRADAHQIGFGVSSISYVAGNYFQNLKELKKYVEAIESESLASFRGHLLSRDDAIRRDVILQIMCRGFIDFASIDSKWGIIFENYFHDACRGGLRTALTLSDFIHDGLLELRNRKLHVIGDGFLFLRNMAMVFDAYLEGIREKAVNPTFSRTV